MIKPLIKHELTRLLSLYTTIESDDLVLESPKQKEWGDFSTPICFKLARTLKKAPQQIAQEAIDCIEKEHQEPMIFSLTSLNGFINVTLTDRFLKETFFSLDQKKPVFDKLSSSILLEYVSANPTGPLHIGHGRWAVLGSCIGHLLSFTDQSFDTEFYINDAGRQVTLFRDSVLSQKEGRPLPEDGYHGDYIKELARVDSDPLEAMVTQQRATLSRLGVDFDQWKSELTLHESGQVQAVLDVLTKKGFTYEKEGATWFKSAELGDEKDRVLVKSDGLLTYFLVDIAYHFEKMERGYSLLVNIWGADHHGYVPRVKAAIEALSDEHLQSELKVLIGQLVSLSRQGEPVRMSKRSGEMITLDEVVDEIGVDATRYFLIEKQADTHVEFDLDLATQQNRENPVYYVQYAHARMSALLRKISPSTASYDEVSLSAEERALYVHCCKFYDEIWEATQQFSPYKLTQYATQCAKLFHLFYEACPLKSADDVTRAHRLAIVEHTRLILSRTLSLLGVSSPESM